MTVRDAKKPPPLNSSEESWRQWLSEVVWEKLNVDAYKALTSPAGADKVLIFDNSADQARGITLTNLFSQTLLKTALGVSVGNWTPVLGTDGTSGTHVYADQVGRYLYVQALSRVWCDFHIDITTKDNAGGPSTGNLQITGLPYAACATAGYRAIAPLRYSAIDLNVGAGRYSACGTINAGAQLMTLVEIGDNVTAPPLTVADFANGSIIIGSISYETA